MTIARCLQTLHNAALYLDTLIRRSNDVFS